MIIDYKNDREFALANGVAPEDIFGEIHFSGGRVVTDVTFRNFHHLCVDDTIFERCTFEDCSCISLSSCQVKECTFRNTGDVTGHYTNFFGCTFHRCRSEGALLVIDSQGRVEGCTFDNITALWEDGYVVQSFYGKQQEVEKVIGCRFIDCQVENEAGDMCRCSYSKSFPSRTIEEDHADYATCHFERCSRVTGGEGSW